MAASKSPAATKGKKKSFAKGEKVAWTSSQGTVKGKVVRKATHDMKIKDFKISASKADPKIVVQSDKTGAKAAHKPGSLRKLKG